MHGHEEVLSEYALTVERVEPLSGGLINTTFLVSAKEGRFVLQSLHPVFGPDVHEDIEAITRHLEKKGMATPLLVRTRGGGLFVQREKIWRVQTYLESESYDRVTSPALASAAGELVGRFHNALADLQHEFKFARKAVHDTAAHMATLKTALDEHRPHRYYARIAPIGEAVLNAALPPLDLTHKRVVHGDLKISNLLFRNGQGLALIDLDTLARMPLAHEMGDAWRSWCNPGGEEDVHARFDLGLFAAAAKGYLRCATPSPEERDSLVAGVATIALELSARFCADALRESYFGWNKDKYPDRSTHNLVRATSQLRLYESVMAQRAEAENAVRSAVS